VRQWSWQTAATAVAVLAILVLYHWFAAIPMQRAYTRWLLSGDQPCHCTNSEIPHEH